MKETRSSSSGTVDESTEIDVLVLAPYPHDTAPGQRFRFEQWAARAQSEGVRLHVSSFLSPSVVTSLHQPGNRGKKAAAVIQGNLRRLRDIIRARRFHAALVFREATPIGYPWVERVLGATGVPYVFDFDDAIYLSHVSDANRRFARLKFAGKAAIIARHAALVTPGNDYLADWASRYSDSVQVIPTTIDLDVYVPTPRPVRDRAVCVGWSGSVTTVQYLEAVAPVLRELQQEHGVAIRVIGDRNFGIPGATVDAIAWQASTEVEDLSALDVGIMPLPDDDWARGKCGLKALQYMALGIPTVMSPVGVNAKIAAGGAALLADDPSEWKRTLTDLITRPELRASVGELGKARVKAEYSADVVAPVWAGALRRVAGHAGQQR